MSEDSFAEQIHNPWAGRRKTSFNGMLMGLHLFVGAFSLLFWNEGRALNPCPPFMAGEGGGAGVIDCFHHAADAGHEQAMKWLIAQNLGG